MNNLIKNLICMMLACLFMANILFDTVEYIPAIEEAPTKLDVAYETEIEEPELEIVELDIPITTLSYEDRKNTVKSAEVCKAQYQAENGIIKEKEVGYNDYGDIACASIGVEPYQGYITKYMDLKCRMDISVDQMNDLIDYWLDGRDSELKNQGAAFIKASKETGLDPVFLLSLAAQEGGWEVSSLHASKNNPYSINMCDANPSKGYNMGDEFSEGIINGAIWIKDNYYDNGQTTLYDMIYGAKRYSSSADHWINSITNIMSQSYKYLSK